MRTRDRPRRPSLWLLVGAAYFLLPLLATLIFSLKSDRPGSAARSRATARSSTTRSSGRRCGSPFILSLETIALALALLIPTVYWVHLKLPRLRPVIGFLALVPFVVPPIILVVGLLDVYKGSPEWFYARAVRLPRRRVRDPRVPVHLLLARRGLPRDRRAHADGGLAEPRRERGARRCFRVILPNIRPRRSQARS